jgi:hypothetical protein
VHAGHKYVKSKIKRAAKQLGWPYAHGKYWYRGARRVVEAWEMDQLRRATAL